MVETDTDAVILRVSGVDKSYGTVKALSTISFELNAGFYALLGPNGAGKSTLFQLLTGLFVPDRGAIHIHGLDVRTDLTAALARLGVVFQQPSLDLDLTVLANLNFYGRLHGLSDRQIRQRASEELEQLGMSGVEKQRCRTLSGGNRRKIELARALLTRPELLLMDEATVGLDPASRSTLLSYVHRLCAERGMSVLWATHLIDEAEQADQVLVLHQGVLLEKAAPAALVAATNTDNLLDAFLHLSGQTLQKTERVLSV